MTPLVGAYQRGATYAESISTTTTEDTAPRPLDIAEQEEIVADFQKQILSQARTFKIGVGATALAFAAFLSACALSQLQEPWGLKFHAEYAGILAPAAVSLGDLLSAIAAMASGLALLSSIPPRPASAKEEFHYTNTPLERRLLRVGLGTGAAAAGFWGVFTYAAHMRDRALGVYPWKIEVAWIPVCPLLISSACSYISSAMVEASSELAGLRSSMYHHKEI